MLSPGGIPKVTTSPQTLPFPHAAVHPRLTDGQTSPAAAVSDVRHLRCARAVGVHQPEARDKDGGHWKPARHVPLEYAARHGSVTERPRASPSCSAQTKPQFRFHPPGVHPQPGQRDKASSDSQGWRTKAFSITTRCPWIRGALPASLRAPKLQPCSAGAQGRGGRRGLMGSPRCCVG